MNIGIIGAKSSHTELYMDALKESKFNKEFKISHICGFDAPDTYGELQGIELCHDPRELIKACDGVLITLREGMQHRALAELCMKYGKPVFVDKPFACTLEDAKAMLDFSRNSGVACTGGSALTYMSKVLRAKEQLPQCKKYAMSFTADPYSIWGGWSFYGSHLTDMCVYMFGEKIESVSANIDGDCVKVDVVYPDFSVEMKTTPDRQPLLLRTAEDEFILNGLESFQAAIEHFCNVILGKESAQVERLVYSTALLETIFKSLGQKKVIDFKAK